MNDKWLDWAIAFTITLALLVSVIVLGHYRYVKSQRQVGSGPVLLRTSVTTNHIPEHGGGGTPEQPFSTIGWIVKAHDEIVTNYSLSFWDGTSYVELINVKKQ